MNTNNTNTSQRYLYIAVIAIGALTLVNTGILIGGDAPTGLLASGESDATPPTIVEEPSESDTSGDGISSDTADLEVPPSGTPAVYGETMDIAYDDVTPDDPQKSDETIREMAILDQEIDHHEDMTEEELERYIDITTQISCEYCCDAPSIITREGDPACGCLHSFAMRGLSKYLITSHGDTFSDEEILAELSKWKALYFPDQMEQKANIMAGEGIDVNYVSLGSNEYRGIEQQVAGGQGGMVGSC